VLAATNATLDGLPVNIGSGQPTTIRAVAEAVAEAVHASTGLPVIAPVARGEFRPGEIRHLTPDITRIRTIGYEPRVNLETGIARYLEWIAGQGAIRDYFAAAEATLREKRIVQRITAAAGAREQV